jgi:hypothetical protein
MSRQFFCLLLILFFCYGEMDKTAVCAESNPPLVLAPDSQQGQVKSSAPSISAPQNVSPSQEALHDIRGPVLLPETPGLLFWFLMGIAAAVLVGLIFYFWKRQKKGRKQPGPHEIAMGELARLRPMMNPEQALLYAEQLSEILRRYIEARFLIPSTRQTTREFFLDLNRTPLAVAAMKEHHAHLQECLEQCDMAKFAHCVPDRQSMEVMEQAVQSFIEATGQSVDEKDKG